jgi:hypothetical protein
MAAAVTDTSLDRLMILTLAGLLLSASLHPLARDGSTGPTIPVLSVCPPDDAWQRQLAILFASDADYADVREEAGVSGVDPATLRALTDTTDGAACAAINALVAPGGAIGPSDRGPYAYYRLGSRYLVVNRQPQGSVNEFSYMGVLDSNFQIVTYFGI